MGYIVLPAQLNKIKQLTNNDKMESIELLWLPGGIQLIVWTRGTPNTYLIDEDGGIGGDD